MHAQLFLSACCISIASLKSAEAEKQRLTDAYIRQGCEAGNAIMKDEMNGFDARPADLAGRLDGFAKDLRQLERDGFICETDGRLWIR